MTADPPALFVASSTSKPSKVPRAKHVTPCRVPTSLLLNMEHHLLQTTRHFFGDSSSSYASFDPAKELGVQENCKRTWADFGQYSSAKEPIPLPNACPLCGWFGLRQPANIQWHDNTIHWIVDNSWSFTTLLLLNVLVCKPLLCKSFVERFGAYPQDPIGFWDPLGLSADKAGTECLHSNSRSEMAATMKFLRNSHENA